MKRLSLILLAVFTIQLAVAQNTLDLLGLEDTTPATVAYSLRKLSTSYLGNAVQVRRSSDNETQDIGFDSNGDLDTVTLLAFAGSNDAFVSIWYDQSGNSRNLVKTDNGYQPKIVFNGSLKYIGTRVAIDFSGGKGLVYSGSLTLSSVSSVVRSESTNWPGFHAILDGSPRIGGILQVNGNTFHYNTYPNTIWKNGISKTNTESLAPTNEAMILSISTKINALTKVFIGNYDGGNDGGAILQTEAIGFSTLNAPNSRLSIECNQGSYYGISMTSCTTAIVNNPSSSDYFECSGNTAIPLVVDASGLNLTYQWYSNSTASTSGGTLIADATKSSFTPPTLAAGSTYYYVVVSGSSGAPVTSEVSGAITVETPPLLTITPATVAIKSGESVTLTASGASTYFWSFDNATPLNNLSNCKLAVGLRLLTSSYTGSAIRLRRASDNVEADFGFSGTNLDITSINTWLNGATGYCVKLYDQSGNGNDMVAPSAAAQPTYIYNGLNDKPILRFSTSQSIKNSVNFTPPFTVIYTAKQTGPSRGRVLNANNNWLLGWWGGNKSQAHFDGWISSNGGIAADNDAYVYSATGTGSASEIFENGISKTINTSGGKSGPNGLRINENEASNADVAEIFAFNTVLSTIDRLAVEKSTGSYYGIYAETPLGSTPEIIVNPTETKTYQLTGYSSNGGCSVSKNITVTVLKDPNLGGFDSQVRTYFDGSYQISQPTSSGTGTFSYTSSNTSVATISGTTVTITGPGTTTITATQENDGTYYESAIASTLTVNEVTVLTKNGKISSSDFNYINKNGALTKSNSLTKFGQSVSVKSSDGLSSASAGISALQIKRDFPDATDGLYWITNPNINDGTPFQIYADMTTDGGGWTLIMTNNASSGWTGTNAILRNETSPSIGSNYSIISWADDLKKSSSGFQYMMDANNRGHWGGIWTANQAYSFVSTSNLNTDITENSKFDNWNYANDGMEKRMPWYSPTKQGIITTSDDANNNWWGTLIASGGWAPAPWMNTGMPNPGIIWYWVR